MRFARFRSLSIPLKLLFIIIGICTVALMLSAIIQTVLNWNNERRTLISRLATTAEIISLQSRAALEFMDPVVSKEDLRALQADPHIRRACLYNEAGREFAAYFAGSESGCPPVQPQQTLMRWDRLEMFHTISYSDRRVGSLYIERELSDMHEQIREQITYQLLTILAVVAWVWLISFYFQRMISQPIIQLAENAWLFSHDRNQQIRITKTSNDEIGTLIDSFNTMMEEIRRNEHQLEQAIAELTRSNTELERFAHICSHDLQEPLRMVSSYTMLLKKRTEGTLSGDTLQYLQFIMEGAERMRELIKDILAYARMGQQAEAMQRIDLNQVLEYVLKNLAPAIDERRASIHIDKLPTIIGNKTLLLQVFQNLISNAIKFTTRQPAIRVGAERLDSGWEFFVQDNGIGIDAQYHEKIFEIFKRLNRREDFQGTGIGLAIVKKAVHYHGGQVRIESELGKGTTFFFTIPDYKTEET